MSLLDALRYRWRVLTRPDEHDADVADDMEFFLGAEARQREHAGRGTLSPGDARLPCDWPSAHRARVWYVNCSWRA